VADLRPDLGGALADAFRAGYLDVPFCLHPDNARRTRSFIDTSGRLQWSSIGSMPIHEVVRPSGSVELTAAGLLASLSYVERKFDNASLGEYRATPVQATGSA
jgi:methylaspartate mutase epsilon subunit